MNNRNKVTEYAMPAVVVGILFMIILALNGLWPFGKATIDYYDMAQWADPFYYHNFDQLRGLKSFVYDWYSGLGREIPGLCEPSVFDVMLYIIPRDMILEFMSIMMMIKIMAASFTMGLFVRDINCKIPYLFRLMISSGYGLCGFVLINYTIPQWIDLAAIVPLVLMYAQRSLKTGKITGLSLSILPIMILDYYFGIQTLLFVFLVGGAYCVYRYFSSGKDHDENKLMFSRLLAGIVLGLGLSAFSWLPDMAFSFSSARFGNGMNDESLLRMYVSLLKNVQPAYLSRWFALLGLSFASALVVTGLYGNIRKKNIGTVIFSVACIFMVTIQLFLESVHLILHFGSYVDYPMRNGFMIYCIMAGLAAGLYENGSADRDRKDDHMRLGVVLGIVFAITAVAGFRMWYVKKVGITDHTVLLLTMFMMLVFCAVHLLFVNLKNGKYRYLCVAVWAVELLIFGMIMIGKPLYDTPYGNDPEQEGEFIRISDQLVEGFGDALPTGEDAATRRIKNPDSSLNANYGEIMRRETLAGWTNFATAGQINGAVSLGYSNQFTRLLDAGGNIFSDTLLHITDVVSHCKLDDRLYEKVASTEVVTDHMTGDSLEYVLYRNRYEMPFAMPVNIMPDLGAADGDPVGIINEYAKALGLEETMAEYVDVMPEDLSEKGHDIKIYNIGSVGHRTYYLTGRCTDTDHYNTRITVNDKVIEIPSIAENDNDLFPAHFNNNTVELGSFDDEEFTVKVDMDISDPETQYQYRLYSIDRDALEGLCNDMAGQTGVTQGKRSLDITTDNSVPGMTGILIPVSYSRGWSAYVDGKRSEISDSNGLFMYVPAACGSSIHMTYFPPFMPAGIATAFASVVILAVIFIKDRKKEPVADRSDIMFGRIYLAAFAVAFTVIYVIPCIYFVYHIIGR